MSNNSNSNFLRQNDQNEGSDDDWLPEGSNENGLAGDDDDYLRTRIWPLIGAPVVVTDWSLWDQQTTADRHTAELNLLNFQHLQELGLHPHPVPDEVFIRQGQERMDLYNRHMHELEQEIVAQMPEERTPVTLRNTECMVRPREEDEHRTCVRCGGEISFYIYPYWYCWEHSVAEDRITWNEENGYSSRGVDWSGFSDFLVGEAGYISNMNSTYHFARASGMVLSSLPAIVDHVQSMIEDRVELYGRIPTDNDWVDPFGEGQVTPFMEAVRVLSTINADQFDINVDRDMYQFLAREVDWSDEHYMAVLMEDSYEMVFSNHHGMCGCDALDVRVHHSCPMCYRDVQSGFYIESEVESIPEMVVISDDDDYVGVEFGLPDEGYDAANQLAGRDDKGHAVDFGVPAPWVLIQVQQLEEMCPICRDDEGGDCVRCVNSHTMHRSCVDAWCLTSPGICPICRRAMYF
jgi:hypothetical protein